jgi:hypothetical protein
MSRDEKGLISQALQYHSSNMKKPGAHIKKDSNGMGLFQDPEEI